MMILVRQLEIELDGPREGQLFGSRARTLLNADRRVGNTWPVVSGMLAIIAGCLVETDWLLDIQVLKQPIRGSVPMNPTSAACFAALGLALMLHTALTFLVVALGILSLHPDRGIVGLVTGSDLAAIMVRRLLPTIVALPIAMGFA